MVNNTHTLRTVDPIPEVDPAGTVADCLHQQKESLLGTGLFHLTVNILSIRQGAPVAQPDRL